MDNDWSRFAVAVFIDSNVALECLALEQLPWRDISPTGPILILVTPTVLGEVDVKKHHARLGDHARRFNNRVRPLLGDADHVIVRSSPAPVVALAFADCAPIDWAKYPDLDRQEADARIVAEVLNVRGTLPTHRLVMSQDTRPLKLAKQHGLRVHQVGTNWLRPKEISEAEKKAASLQRDLDAMKRREPALALSLEADPTSVAVYRVAPLSASDRASLLARIVALHPMPKQLRLGLTGRDSSDYDVTLEDRYQVWRDEVIPQFVAQYERKLELNFGQVALTCRIENSGQVPAESLLLNLSVAGGWFNARRIWSRPGGPMPPPIRSSLFSHAMRRDYGDGGRRVVRRYEFEVSETPQRSSTIELTCEDFRHQYEYVYRTIAWVDPDAASFEVRVVGTAANLYGSIEQTLTLERTVASVQVSDLVDLATLEFRNPPDIEKRFMAADEAALDQFESDGDDWDH